MTMKPFEIQGAELVLGGVQLQAGNTGVVIPGVTQATSYGVDEVKDNDGDQSITFSNTPIIIDVIIFNDYVNNGSTAMRAEYQAELEDNGYIDEIEVNYGGVYSQQDYNDIMGASPLYAYTGTASEPFNPFVPEDWTSIPFRVKMRAGEVETIGGGGSSALTELEDVNLVDLQGGQSLIYNADSERWENSTPTNGGGNTDTGNMTFSGDYITGSDGVARMRTLNTQQTASYSFTPGVDYSTAVWDGTGITFNDPTQTIYDAIWELTDVSRIEVQVSGNWFTVTSSGSSTPGMPQAPTLWLNETAVDGPLNIDIVDITINQGTESYVEIDGTDFRVDVQDDIRMYANDAFRLINRSVDSSIEIQTNDGTHVWEFQPDGTLTLPGNGDILRNGTSVLFSGSYNNLTDKPLTVSGSDLTATGSVTIPQGSSFQTANGYILTSGIRGQTSDVQDTLLIAQNRFSIYTNNAQASTWEYKSWSFMEDGNLIFPDATTQSTAWTGSVAAASVTGLVTVATSGSYDDLTGKPTIPSLGALSVSVNTIQGGAAGQVGTSFSKSVDFNGSNYSTGGGTLPFINMGADSDVDNIRAGWIVTFASGETRIVASEPYKPLGTYWFIGFNSSYFWNAGDVMPITFTSPDYEAGSDPVVVLSADNNNWTFDNVGKLTLPAGGDIVDSTGTSVLGGGTGGSGSYVIKDADFTADTGKTYWLNSGTSSKTMTLPASPAAGDWVKIYDGSMNWPTYSLTVNGNGNNIKIYNMGGGAWGTAASTATYNQSLVSPAGPFPIALIWDGTDWYGAI